MSGFDGENRSAASRGDQLLAYARLLRVPNLFTAPPDVLLGLALAASVGATVSIPATLALAVASAMLYAAGTTLNDYFDAAEDARHRPERPIPSGAVPGRTALALGVGLLAGGVIVAWFAGGSRAGVVAFVLAGAIVAYDGAFKGTVLGFLFMGASRSLNVLLGVAAAVASRSLPPETLALPVLVGLYVAAVTYMAESESGESTTLAVPVAIGGTVLALVGGLAALLVRSPTTVELAVGVALLAAFAVWTGRALGRAYRDPTPATIGPAVGACVLGLVVLDAALAVPSGIAWAAAIVTFLLPAIGLSTAFDVT